MSTIIKQFTVLGLMLLSLGFASGTGKASSTDEVQDSPPASTKKGWFGRQLSNFKGYPHLDMAYRLTREGKSEDAAQEFLRYLQIKPDDLKARSDYMNLLYDMRRYDKALAEARHILTAAPDDPAVLLTLAQCLVRTGDSKAAIEPMQRAVALTRKDVVLHRVAVLAASDVLTSLDRYQEALSLLNSLPETPGDFALQQAKGMLLTKSGDHGHARESFEKALAAAGSDKQKIDALRALGVTSTDLGDYTNAREYLVKAHSMAPNDTAILRQLAVLATKAGDAEEAARLGRELTQRAPTPENKIFLANVLASLKRYDDAAKELVALLAGKPGPEEAFRLNMQLGVLYMDAGKPDHAAVVLRDAVTLRRDPLALVRLSRAEQQAGQTREAAKTLQEAVALGANPDTLVELATLMSKLDNNAAALAYLDKALREPQSPEQHARALAMKATLLAESGDNAAARQALQEALKAPGLDKSRLLSTLGEICLRLADYPAAVSAYTQAIAAGAGQETELALAEALVKNNQPEKAVSVYNALVGKAKTQQQRDSYRLGLANLLSRLGRNAEAAGMYQELAMSGQPQLLRQAGQSFASAHMDNQAIASLEAYARQSASQTEKAEALLALGNIYASQHNAAKAYTAFSQAASLASGLSQDKRAEIALGGGMAAVLSGKAAQAVELLNQALGLLGDGVRKAKALMALAQAYAVLGQTQNAAAAWQRAAATPGALRSDRAAADENLGYTLIAVGNAVGAEAAFRRALDVSAANWRVLSALGQIEYKAGRYQEALDDFSRSLALHDDAATRIAMGRCYDKLGKPGLALVNFDQAAPQAAALPPEQRRAFFMAQGFLYAEEFRYEAAIAAFKATLGLGYDPETATRLGRLERLGGHPQEARQTLQAVDASKLPNDLKILRLSELASLAEADKDYNAARKYLEECLAVTPDADSFFRLGNVLRDSGHIKEAVAAYRQAVAMEDSNRYLTALGYALSESKQYAEAAKVFETVLNRDPDYLRLWEDLGYAYMHECDNTKSVERFKRAIDNAPLRPVDSPADQEEVDKDVYRMRKEVTKLETHFTTTAYMSYIAGDAGPLSSSSGNSVDTIRSGGGVEFAWIPPKIGFRDDRIFQMIGRISGNLNKDSLEFDDKSWQGAVGVRYKPLQSQNLNVGFERLFKIGQSAEENWLLRGMYSWTNGYDVKPKEKWWNYTFFYGEYDYYMENDRRSMFYAEGRQGITFNVGDRFLLTPHLVADVRVWIPDSNESSCVEGGGGLSLKYIFNRSAYEVERSSLEFLLQYKYGTLFNKTNVKDRENVINALFLTTILKF